MLKPPFFQLVALCQSPSAFNVKTKTRLQFQRALRYFSKVYKWVSYDRKDCNSNCTNTTPLQHFFVLDWRQNKSAFCHLQISKRASTSKKGQPPKEAGKGQLWDGIVSIILVEGKKMIPMDDSGRSVVSCICPIFGECCGNILYNQYKRAFFPHDIHFQYKLGSYSFFCGKRGIYWCLFEAEW